MFDPPPTPVAEVWSESRVFPVHRIYCVGRNYAEHVREMGKDPAVEPPFFFLKPANAIVSNGAAVPYPPCTANFQPEAELVVAIGKEGANIAATDALDHVYGYAVGNDFTRRDLQLDARRRGWPWDTGKSFDYAAGVGPIHPASEIGHIVCGRLWLTVDGELRQEADIGEMIWSVPMVIAELSRFFVIKPGDLLFTGTPAGVAPLQPGQVVTAGIEGLRPLENRIGVPAFT